MPICKTCKKYFQSLVIARHRAMHRDKKEDCIIEFYAGEFSYRKNVSYKRVAEDVNNFFLIELVCAITRGMRKSRKPLCDENYEDCPLEIVWKETKLRL